MVQSILIPAAYAIYSSSYTKQFTISDAISTMQNGLLAGSYYVICSHLWGAGDKLLSFSHHTFLFKVFKKNSYWFCHYSKNKKTLITVLKVNQDLQTLHAKSAFQLCGVCGNLSPFFLRGGLFLFCFCLHSLSVLFRPENCLLMRAVCSKLYVWERSFIYCTANSLGKAIFRQFWRRVFFFFF